MVRMLLGLCAFLTVGAAPAQVYVNPEVNDGIYLSPDQLLNNTPINPEQILFDLSPSDPDFYEQLAREDSIKFISGTKEYRVSIDSTFAFSIAGVPHIRAFNDFFRCVVFGRLCYFATVRPLSGIPLPQQGPSTFIGPWGMMMAPSQEATVANEEFILDLQTERFERFSRSSLANFIADDPALLEAFDSLSRRQQRIQKYTYLREYNRRNPLNNY